MRNKHEQVPLIIDGKKVMIDVGIVPLIKWFNSHYGVKTLHCCAGDIAINPAPEGTFLPYVEFKATEKFRRFIYCAFRKFCKHRDGYFYYTERDHLFLNGKIDRDCGSCISFPSRADMLAFYEFLLMRH